MRFRSFLRAVYVVAIAMTAWLATTTNVWAADAPLCHHTGGSAQGRDAVLISDDSGFEIEGDDAPAVAHKDRAPSAPEEGVTDKADPAIVTGWLWFPRAPVSRLHFVIEEATGSEGVSARLDRPPQS